ncbi:MAG TPA: AAA family ATPase [Candidatus Paceibacterota bacterium]|nr:AAA family ATPase [Candidatus Paceibacterota bacterium]
MNTQNDSNGNAAKLLQLEARMRERIRGQNHVLPRVISLLQRGELGLTKPDRPRGSFLFLGPTGVGKTETALSFTNFLFGEGRLFRFDMSEYQTQDSLGILLGGKLGERGTLAMSYDKAQSGTLLFDEIEKAHVRVLDIFLQILDAARVTMASGETLDLSGFYVVFTSNVGGADLLNLQHSTFATMERHVLARAQQVLRPELFARITEKLVFNRLSYDCQLEIAQLLLDGELKFLREKGHDLRDDPTVLPFVVRRGFHPKLGARPMRDTLEKVVGDAVAIDLLTGGTGCGRLSVDEAGNCLAIAAPAEAGSVKENRQV